MEYLFPRVEINRILNRFRDRVIDFVTDYNDKKQDLIITVDVLHEGPYRLQILENVDVEEKKRYDLYCETLKMKQKSSA